MEWTEVQPVLDATYRLLREEDQIAQGAVCEALGRPAGDERTIRALGLLYKDGYIDGITVDEITAPIYIRATGKGLQEASGWPASDGAERSVEVLLRLLDERIEDPKTPEPERSKLRRVREAVAEAAPRFLGEVLAAYVAKVMPPAG